MKYFAALLLLFGLVISLACVSQTTRPSHLMPGAFWGAGEDSDLPAAFEAVCVDEEEPCGDTHFRANSHDYLISYRQLSSPEDADASLSVATETMPGATVIRTGIVLAKDGSAVGSKALIRFDKDVYGLVWTRGKRRASVMSDSLVAIEAYEADRGL